MNKRIEQDCSKPLSVPASLLLELIEHLPHYEKRIVVLGELESNKLDKDRRLEACVKALGRCGWTDNHIRQFFKSSFPFPPIQFSQELVQRGKFDLEQCLSKAQKERTSSPHVLSRLLDTEWRLGKRQPIPLLPKLQRKDYLTTKRIALHRLASVAEQLYRGKRLGVFLAALPIGLGKTTQFLIPFVIECAKRNPGKGIIIAMERREDIKTYASQVNKAVGREVAFALFSHDPNKEVCPKGCTENHKEWREQANHYPMLFLTHEMLSRKGAEIYQTWKDNGVEKKRVLVILDERPGAWFKSGEITERDIGRLKKGRYLPPSIHQAIKELQQALFTTSDKKKIRLKTPLTPKQVDSFAVALSDLQDEDKENPLLTTFQNLYALSKGEGIMVRQERIDSQGWIKETKKIILARSLPFPHLPTLILDATGDIDPAYPSDVHTLPINPWEGEQRTS